MKKRLKSVLVILITAFVMTLTGCTGGDPAAVIAKAQKLREARDFNSAIIELKGMLQKHPDHAEGRYLLGVTFLDYSDYLSAEKELRRARDLGYQKEKLNAAYGDALLRVGKFKEVLSEIEPDEKAGAQQQAQIVTLRGRALLGLGRTDDASELFAKALVLRPEFTDALLGQAVLAMRERKIDESAKLAERALASTPTSIDAWLLSAAIREVTADRDGAMAAYRKVLALDKEKIDAHVGIVTLHIGNGALEDARKQLDQLRKIAPKMPMVRLLSAQIEYQGKNFPAAREAILDVLKASPKNMSAVLLAGTIEYALGSYVQAHAHALNVVQAVPPLLAGHKLLIVSLAKSGQVPQAIEAMEQLLPKAPNDFGLALIAGELYLQVNEFAKAVEQFEKASKLDPKNVKARAGLGLGRFATGDTERAFAGLEAIVELDPENYSMEVLIATLQLQRGNYDQAMRAAQSLEKKQPKHPLPYNLKGLIYMRMSEGPAARKAFERALELQPVFVPAAINLARLDLEDKQPKAARRRLEAVLEKDKGNTRALVELAKLGELLGATPNERVDWLERARAASPNSVQVQGMLARAYALSGNWKKALEVAQQARAARPDDPTVLDTLGATQMGAGATEQAVRTYERLVALQPKSAAYLMQLAKAYALNGDKPSAAKALRKAVSLQPEFIEAQMALAAYELGARRFSEAMKIAQLVKKQAAKSPAGFVLEGDVMIAEKKYPQAIKAYETAYDMGRNGAVLIKLHAALTRAGKAEDAEQRLAQSLNESPDDTTVRDYAGEASLKNGNYRKAIEHFEWSLKKQPDNAWLLNNLAWSYYQVKDARALETAERAYKLRPDAAAADTLGWILVEQGNIKRGLELLQTAVTAMPKATEPRYHLAHALVKAGDHDKARKELEKLLADFPDSRFAKDARELLAKLGHRG